MHVFFFDIDGTLILTGGAGKDSMVEALLTEFHLEKASADVSVVGRSDRGIAGELFQMHGIEDSQANWERFRARYLELLPVNLPKRQGQVLPGVPDLLEQLDRRDDTALGLLTGNVEQAARVKLEYYGLYQHFAFGGFGDRCSQREGVAKEALAAARAHLDSDPSIQQIWVIGDTPLDIQCARSIGAKSLVVTTGWHSAEELAAAAPDRLVTDLSDPKPVLDLLP